MTTRGNPGKVGLAEGSCREEVVVVAVVAHGVVAVVAGRTDTAALRGEEWARQHRGAPSVEGRTGHLQNQGAYPDIP